MFVEILALQEPELTEKLKVAFEFTSDLSKQLITLSTGILALTITFTRQLVEDPSRRLVRVLKFGWASYFLSIIFGIMNSIILSSTPIGSSCSAVCVLR